MSAKLRFTIPIVAILLLCSSAMASGPDKSLGYGFTPDLVPGKDFVAGQLIVGTREGMGIQTIKEMASVAGVQVPKDIDGTILLQFGSEQAALDAVPALLSRPEVAFVERNGFMGIRPKPEAISKCGGCDRSARRDLTPQSISDDPLAWQWHLWMIRKMAPDLPPLSSSPPTVAVLDTGVNYFNPDLANKVILGKNCVTDNFNPRDDHYPGHGTHIAGLIGAEAGNGQYGEGVCPNCMMLIVKVLRKDGSGTFFDIAQGMAYARKYSSPSYPPVKVIITAFSGSNSSLIAAEVLKIKQAGKLLVAPAGDDNTIDTTNAYPGADPNTGLRVMATDFPNCRLRDSNFSPPANPTQYNIAAPGDYINSLYGAGWGTSYGTESASAIAAGSTALVWGQYPSLTREVLISIMTDNGRQLSCGFPKPTPLVDVRKAILGTSETGLMGYVVDPVTITGPDTLPNVPTNVTLVKGNPPVIIRKVEAYWNYEMTGLAPNTGMTLKADRSQFIPTKLRYPVKVVSGVMQGPYTDAFPQKRPAGYATLTLDWKTAGPVWPTTGCTGSCLGWDFDLYVKTPSGLYIGRENPGDLLCSPYVILPTESGQSWWPLETIIIGKLAEGGVYKVFVDKPNLEGNLNPYWANSWASSAIYKASSALAYFMSAPASCGTDRYWYLGDLTKSGTSYAWSKVNSCSNTKP